MTEGSKASRSTRRRSFPTKPEPISEAAWKRGAWLRRALLALFAALVVGAAFGLMGLRHAEAVSSAGGFELRVRYPDLSRPGIASPFDVHVSSDGPFTGPVTLKITHEYFTLFDLNGIFPAPSAETVEGDYVVWEFDPPEGTTFRVHVDWRVQPSVHRGTAGKVQLLVDDVYVTEVAFDTKLRP